MNQITIFTTLLAAIFLGAAPQASALPAKQVFVFNNSNLPFSMDPALVSDVYSSNVLMQVFEGLTNYSPRDLSPLPGVAKRWTISKDSKTYTFYLNPASLWSDGTPVTAQDFVAAWQRVLDPKTKAPLASNLFYLKNGRNFHHQQIKDPEQLGVKALAKDVLEVTLEYPVPYFLQLTSFITLYPLPRQVYKQHGNRWADPNNIVANGAFLPVSRADKNLLVLKRNARYWDAANVKLQEVRVYGIQNAAEAVRLYGEGKLDYTGETPIPSLELPKWRYTSDYRSTPWFAVNFLRFNTTRAPFDNLEVRRAVTMAIDKAKIVNFIVPGGHQATGSMVPLGSVQGYTPPTGVGYDPQQAREILGKAGYCVPESKVVAPACKEFPKIEVIVDNNDAEKKMVLAVQQMLKKELGIQKFEMNVLVDFQRYLELRRKGQFDIARSRWAGDYTDPNTFLEIWTSDSPNNNTGWKSERFDSLIRLAAQEQNLRKRMELFSQAEDILIAESPIAPIYSFSQTYLIKPYVRNYFDNLRRLLLLKDVYIEHYATSR